ncbi:hypothetical protein [Allochromatium palmeri]|uniref:hypothetical protein n=1 Tax=Allochromatium palmeri TaxID=231048 RepID=UPI0012D7EA4B|nr:hypothetical protein [Allochromatium palmeri]
MRQSGAGAGVPREQQIEHTGMRKSVNWPSVGPRLTSNRIESVRVLLRVIVCLSLDALGLLMTIMFRRGRVSPLLRLLLPPTRGLCHV